MLEGDLDGADGPASVFIDVIGMPRTPLSVAGVAWRTARHGAFYNHGYGGYGGYGGYHPYHGSAAAATIGMAAIGAMAACAAGSYGYHDSGEAPCY